MARTWFGVRIGCGHQSSGHRQFIPVIPAMCGWKWRHKSFQNGCNFQAICSPCSKENKWQEPAGQWQPATAQSQEHASPWTSSHSVLHGPPRPQLTCELLKPADREGFLSGPLVDPAEAIPVFKTHSLPCLLHSQPHLLLLPANPETLLMISSSCRDIILLHVHLISS